MADFRENICGICSAWFSNAMDVLNHIYNVHTPFPGHECNMCNNWCTFIVNVNRLCKTCMSGRGPGGLPQVQAGAATESVMCATDIGEVLSAIDRVEERQSPDSGTQTWDEESGPRPGPSWSYIEASQHARNVGEEATCEVGSVINAPSEEQSIELGDQKFYFKPLEGVSAVVPMHFKVLESGTMSVAPEERVQSRPNTPSLGNEQPDEGEMPCLPTKSKNGGKAKLVKRKIKDRRDETAAMRPDNSFCGKSSRPKRAIKIRCHECDAFLDAEKMWLHIRKVHNAHEIGCGVCGMKVVTAYSKHLETYHPDILLKNSLR